MQSRQIQQGLTRDNLGLTSNCRICCTVVPRIIKRGI